MRPRSTRSVISVSCARGSTMRAVPQISTLFNPYGLNRSRRWLRDLPVGLDITPSEDATGSQSRSGECLLLKGFELGLRDGARVEKSFRRLDFAGRIAVSRHCLDVLICGCTGAFDLPGLALGHASAPGDQVDQCAEEGHHKQGDDPQGLQPSVQAVVAEQVADDVEQDHQVHHEEEAPDKQPEEIPKAHGQPSARVVEPSLEIPLISASDCAAATLDNRKCCSSPGWVRTTPPRVDRAGTRRRGRRGVCRRRATVVLSHRVTQVGPESSSWGAGPPPVASFDGGSSIAASILVCGIRPPPTTRPPARCAADERVRAHRSSTTTMIPAEPGRSAADANAMSLSLKRTPTCSSTSAWAGEPSRSSISRTMVSPLPGLRVTATRSRILIAAFSANSANAAATLATEWVSGTATTMHSTSEVSIATGRPREGEFIGVPVPLSNPFRFVRPGHHPKTGDLPYRNDLWSTGSLRR